MFGLAIMIAMAGLDAATPSARTGYPKLSRCASPVAQPRHQPDYSAACIAWRETELGRLAALPVDQRRARVARLRVRMGLQPGEGLLLTPSGDIPLAWDGPDRP